MSASVQRYRTWPRSCACVCLSVCRRKQTGRQRAVLTRCVRVCVCVCVCVCGGAAGDIDKNTRVDEVQQHAHSTHTHSHTLTRTLTHTHSQSWWPTRPHTHTHTYVCARNSPAHSPGHSRADYLLICWFTGFHDCGLRSKCTLRRC